MIRKKIYIIAFSVAVLGLFIVQYQYLRIGLNLAQIQFERNVDRVEKEIIEDLATENQLTFLIVQSFNDEAYFTLSKDSLRDASRHFLNDLIKDRLVTQKVNTSFSYLLTSEDNSINLHSPINFLETDSIIEYPIELKGYLPETLQRNLTLELQFKDLNSYFLSQLKGLLIPGFLFLGIIIFVVVWMLRVFYWQRNVITITNDFINNLTHEFKTPVFSINVATKILENDDLEKQKPILLQIRKQVERLNKHIDQVLELASLETRKKYMNLENLDLRPELLLWCENFKLLSDVENFTFNYHLEEGQYKVKASLPHFENAINNLLDNAKKYAEDPEIILKAFLEKDKLYIIIQDNGKGIGKKDKLKVFKKFYRVPEGNLHRVKGYGLGLTYVGEVIKKHKGTIKIDSEINRGTLIKILIPLEC